MVRAGSGVESEVLGLGSEEKGRKERAAHRSSTSAFMQRSRPPGLIVYQDTLQTDGRWYYTHFINGEPEAQ